MKGALVTAAELGEAINAEIKAANGGLNVAVSELAGRAVSASAAGRLIAATWYRLKAAEVLYLNCQYQQAWEFYEQILPDLDQMPDRLKTQVQRNFSFVGLAIGKDTYRSFYESVDRASGQPDRTARARNLLAAEHASRERAHYDSIPALRRELKQAYFDADWSGRKRAHHRLASETLEASRVRQAVHHSLHGENKDAISQLAGVLLKWRRLDLIQAASAVAISSGLLKHAETGAQFIGQIADVLPDPYVELSIQWALRVLDQPTISNQAISCINSVLSCLRQLAFRFSSDQALAVINASIEHSIFHSVNNVREELVKLVLACLNKVKDCDYVLLARQTLPLATTLKHDLDFGPVIELLAALAKKSDDAKNIIAGELLPRGEIVSNLILLNHIADFGKQPELEFCRMVIKRVSNGITSQVQVGDIESQADLTHLAIGSRVDNGTNSQVAVSGGAYELQLIAGFGDMLNPELLDPLIAPVLSIFDHPLNIAQNRFLLLKFLFEIRNRVSPVQAEVICNRLLPRARGSYTERSPFDQNQESTLSRIKFLGVASLAKERGWVIFTLIFIAAEHNVLSQKFREALDDALLAPESELRASGLRALTALPDISRLQKLCLLSCLRDPDIEVTYAASEATRVFLERGLLQAEVPNVLVSVHAGAMSQVAKVRFGAARVLEVIVSDKLPVDLNTLWHKTVRLLKNDIHYSVRSVLSHITPEE